GGGLAQISECPVDDRSSNTGVDQQNRVMTTPPADLSWIGFTNQQRDLLETLHFIGNNGWDRNGQSDEMMPRLLEQAAAADLSLARIKEAMAAVGHSRNELHQLDRWESKRTTGKFGR
ncbi:hypothetical protein, partial [Curtobacterium sp. MCBA15_007]|uniref:hypothetical protein n=2 Tax=Microbacteriaceae TaxID=85023 RepID=UPI000AB9BE2A